MIFFNNLHSFDSLTLGIFLGIFILLYPINVLLNLHLQTIEQWTTCTGSKTGKSAKVGGKLALQFGVGGVGHIGQPIRRAFGERRTRYRTWWFLLQESLGDFFFLS